MEWTDVLVLLGLFCIAAVILYRALRKKKWCPVIYGGGSDDAAKDVDESDAKS